MITVVFPDPGPARQRQRSFYDERRLFSVLSLNAILIYSSFSMAAWILLMDSSLPRTSKNLCCAGRCHLLTGNERYGWARAHSRSCILFLLQKQPESHKEHRCCNPPGSPEPAGSPEEPSREDSSVVFIFLCTYMELSYSGTASKKSTRSWISGNTSILVFTISAIFFRSRSLVNRLFQDTEELIS